MSISPWLLQDLQSEVKKEQMVKSYDGPKVGQLHGRHTVSRYAVHSSNKHCTARCRMIKTEEWHLKKSKGMFSYPMRRGWGSSGGPTGQGRVPGAFGR